MHRATKLKYDLIAVAAVISTSSRRDETFDQSEVRTGLLGFYCGGRRGLRLHLGRGICYGESVHNKQVLFTVW